MVAALFLVKGSPEEQAQEVAGVFLAALEQDDTETAHQLLCQAERANLSPAERSAGVPRRDAGPGRRVRRGGGGAAARRGPLGRRQHVPVDRHQRGRPADLRRDRPALTPLGRGSPESRSPSPWAKIIPNRRRHGSMQLQSAGRATGTPRYGTHLGHAGDRPSSAEVAPVSSGTPSKWVYDFSEGNKDQKDLLGGKGANLAEMTNLGLPVPPGFTITTDACRHYLEHGGTPPELDAAGHRAPAGAREGHGQDPGRPGRPAAGLGPVGRRGEHARDDGDRPQRRPQRRVGAGPGRAVGQRALRLGLLPPPHPDVRQDGPRHRRRPLRARPRRGEARSRAPSSTSTSTPSTSRTSSPASRRSSSEQTGHDFPQDPREQMDLAINAVFDSWNSERAIIYRRRERIPSDAGTAVNVCSMVFGNLGSDSGTGVAFTRDPGSGAQGVYGDYLQNAQGEDVVAGIRNTVPLADLENIDKDAYDELMATMSRLESHYRDLCDIEFTVERNKLWMLQTRIGKRGAAAAFVIATQLVDEGLIDMDEAVRRVTGDQLAQLMFPRFISGGDATQLTQGMNASPGAAVGKAVFSSEDAVQWADRGEKVVLVRRETNPDDLSGMIAAEGVLTSRGGKTSHAAVVARGMGKTCVCGAEELQVDTKAEAVHRPRRHGRQGGRRHLHRRVHRPGLARRGAGRAVGRRPLLRGRDRPGRRGHRRHRAQRAPDPDPRRREAAARRPDQRRHPGGLRPRPAVRRPGHRPVPDRAHVPRRPPEAGREADPGRRRRGAAGRARRPGAAAEAGLPRDLRGDGRPAGDRAAARPAAARVPARPDRAVGARRARRGARRARRGQPAAAGRRPRHARVQPDARPARRPAGPGRPRAVRHAGAGHRRGGRASGRRRAATRGRRS